MRPTLDTRLVSRLERRCLRRADAAYAPSRFVAENVGRDYGVKLAVVRPPVDVAAVRAEAARTPAGPGLPLRYLLHFGLMSAVKGTDVLVRAVTRAWEVEPELTVVLAGGEGGKGYVQGLLQSIGAEGDKRIVWLGAMGRSQMLATLRGAEAAVLPSRSDNLPNTAIEALALGVPVIGSDGASINELVTEGVNGNLVAIGDENALARALVQAWRGNMEGMKGSDNTTQSLEALDPRKAVAGLMALAGYDDDAGETVWRARAA
jgi:glycosyltransferase involved in cell wall biosynthesis